MNLLLKYLFISFFFLSCSQQFYKVQVTHKMVAGDSVTNVVNDTDTFYYFVSANYIIEKKFNSDIPTTIAEGEEDVEITVDITRRNWKKSFLGWSIYKTPADSMCLFVDTNFVAQKILSRKKSHFEFNFNKDSIQKLTLLPNNRSSTNEPYHHIYYKKDLLQKDSVIISYIPEKETKSIFNMSALPNENKISGIEIYDIGYDSSHRLISKVEIHTSITETSEISPSEKKIIKRLLSIFRKKN
ncbi:MAG: hypothetical protein QM687_02400 [Ferruginibacter sp.]